MLAIETKKLNKKYKEKVAVESLDLKINQGELFALLGTNGAGKTTTAIFSYDEKLKSSNNKGFLLKTI